MPMGHRTSLNLKVIISIISFKQNMDLKIQILAGNTLMSRFHVGFEIELPLVNSAYLEQEYRLIGKFIIFMIYSKLIHNFSLMLE